MCTEQTIVLLVQAFVKGAAALAVRPFRAVAGSVFLKGFRVFHCARWVRLTSRAMSAFRGLDELVFASMCVGNP
jgi:hypothetical protein